MKTTKTLITKNANTAISMKTGIKSNAKMLNAVIVASLLTASVTTSVNATEYINDGVAVIEMPMSKEDQKNQAELNEGIGLGTGVVLGAVFAGPVGAIVAGIAGTFIAKHINANDNIDNLELALDQEHEIYQQQIAQSKQTFEQKLQKSEQAYQAELLALEQNYKSTGQLQAENLLMSLQFSTGSSDIAPHYQEQISVLADLLNRNPSMSVDLSGYTDLAGDESINDALSLARVASVKTLLMAQGVDEQRIITFSYGEAAPIVANAEQERSFYDRRVVMKLHNNVNQTAQNQ